MNISSPHSFHIPVMGLGFTIDTPVKVGRYGISSVVSIIEDELVESMREVICRNEGIVFSPIHAKDYDSRANRITAYLNVLNNVVNQQIAKLRVADFETNQEINKYFEMLPESSYAHQLYNSISMAPNEDRLLIQEQLRDFIIPGSIDVNIMTKLDKTNYDGDGNALPIEFCDALAAFRGYANSDLSSKIIFSAGLNPRLYSYCEKFNDFFPDENGNIKKKIVLKVSDYRSALIQGKYLAKKGLWISEFRIESGINCGGHAFISNGMLLGPILQEFKDKRDELFQELLSECNAALKLSNKITFKSMPVTMITAQGGIGTSIENNLLLEYFNLDATGWGSPFLLVPEATNVDKETLAKLAVAKKDDYYLSNASPLGVPFNNFRPSSSELQRKERIDRNRPGSPCYKKYLSSNTEFTEKPICTASRQYQKLKIEQLQNEILDEQLLKVEIAKLEEKDCLCEGLGAPALLINHVTPSHQLSAVTICPGPNLAYFSGVFSLKQMVDHIYGRMNLLNNLNRPSFFINELELYVDFIKEEFNKSLNEISAKKSTYLQTFKNNLIDGIQYYESLFEKVKVVDVAFQKQNLQMLDSIRETLNKLIIPVVPAKG